jgi:hypothetical protein
MSKIVMLSDRLLATIIRPSSVSAKNQGHRPPLGIHWHGEAWRESGDGLDLGQRSAGLRLERDERVAELVEQAHQAGSGQHVPRARSGSGPVRPDLRPDVPGGGVEGESEDLVGPMSAA